MKTTRLILLALCLATVASAKPPPPRVVHFVSVDYVPPASRWSWFWWSRAAWLIWL